MPKGESDALNGESKEECPGVCPSNDRCKNFFNSPFPYLTTIATAISIVSMIFSASSVNAEYWMTTASYAKYTICIFCVSVALHIMCVVFALKKFPDGGYQGKYLHSLHYEKVTRTTGATMYMATIWFALIWAFRERWEDPQLAQLDTRITDNWLLTDPENTVMWISFVVIQAVAFVLSSFASASGLVWAALESWRPLTIERRKQELERNKSRG